MYLPADPPPFGSVGEPSCLENYIERACSPMLSQPNMSLNLEIADLINLKKANTPREAAMAILQHVNQRNTHVSILALHLLDILVKNCGQPFHLQISTQEFLDGLLLRFPDKPPVLLPPWMQKILELIHEWNFTICSTDNHEEELIHIRDIHRLLSFQGYRFPDVNRRAAQALNKSDILQSAEEPEGEDPPAESATHQTVNSPPQSPPPGNQDCFTNEDSTPLPSRRKSLLQKLLIKQAVEVHLAQQTETNNSLAVSGFSSSEDDDNEAVNQDDIDSTDEDPLPSNEPIDDSSDEDKLNSTPNRMSKPGSLGTSSMALDSNVHPANPTKSRIDSMRQIRQGTIFSAKPRSTSSSSHFSPNGSFSLPSSISRSTFDRRSISSNAKLLLSFEEEQMRGHSPSPSSTSTMIEFPLKSSFRRQSYSPQELLNFSNPPVNRTPPSSRAANLATVKHNTQINSRSPSHPVQEDELVRNRLRSGTSKSLNPVACSNSSVCAIDANNMLDDPPVVKSSPPGIPHRIIRTPRSFLLKRRGSLTPLTPPVCGIDSPLMSPSQTHEGELQDQAEDDASLSAEEGEKRKVRFDRDVFCLEFDQLPEELPSSSRVKRAKVQESITEPLDTSLESVQDSSSINSSRRNLRKRNLNVNDKSSNRSRRHSPRLPTPPALNPTDRGGDISLEADDQKVMNGPIDHPSKSSTSVDATVDLNNLTLNPDPIRQPPNKALVTRLDNHCNELQEQLVGFTSHDAPANQSAIEETPILTSHTSHLFNYESTGSMSWSLLGSIRQRTGSLPSDDPSKLKLKINQLGDQLVGLSLSGTTARHIEQELNKEKSSLNTKMIRSQSLPTSSLTNLIPNGLIKFPPLVSTFSPRLKGVKQIFMDQINGLNSFKSSSMRVLFGSSVFQSFTSNGNTCNLVSCGFVDLKERPSSSDDDSSLSCNGEDPSNEHEPENYDDDLDKKDHDVIGLSSTSVGLVSVKDQELPLPNDNPRSQNRKVGMKLDDCKDSRSELKINLNRAGIVKDESQSANLETSQATLQHGPDNGSRRETRSLPYAVNQAKNFDDPRHSIDQDPPPVRTLRPRKNRMVQTPKRPVTTIDSNVDIKPLELESKPSTMVPNYQAKTIKTNSGRTIKGNWLAAGTTDSYIDQEMFTDKMKTTPSKSSPKSITNDHPSKSFELNQKVGGNLKKKRIIKTSGITSAVIQRSEENVRHTSETNSKHLKPLLDGTRENDYYQRFTFTRAESDASNSFQTQQNTKGWPEQIDYLFNHKDIRTQDSKEDLDLPSSRIATRSSSRISQINLKKQKQQTI